MGEAAKLASPTSPIRRRKSVSAIAADATPLARWTTLRRQNGPSIAATHGVNHCDVALPGGNKCAEAVTAIAAIADYAPTICCDLLQGFAAITAAGAR